MRDEFRIRFALQCMLLRERRPESGMILNDAVVYHRKGSRAVKMGMRIPLCNFTVRSPTGMANPQ